nr:PREDICTED: uncharacterized protein LOC107077812 [Lepisosteus oculatus]XP_015206415.1 PREDICTED: uncharacterized protein LOC107077812 [Lepisosteus oculatus]
MSTTDLSGAHEQNNSWSDFEESCFPRFKMVGHCQEPNDAITENSFGEWNSFSQDNTSVEDAYLCAAGFAKHSEHWQPSDVNAHFTRALETNHQKIVQVCARQVLLDSFPLVEGGDEISEARLLSELLEKSPEPQTQGFSCDAATLWSRVEGAHSTLGLVDLWTQSHSRKGLLSSLGISPVGESRLLVKTKSQETCKELSSSGTRALIQTKLLQPSQCSQSAPHYLYQISQEWISSHGQHLPIQHNKRGFFS